jgi:hypothetical protein
MSYSSSYHATQASKKVADERDRIHSETLAGALLKIMEETLIANRLLYDPKLIKRVLKAFQEPNNFEKQHNLLQSMQMLEHHIHLQEISIRMNKLEYENLQVEALQKRDDVERHQGKIAKLEAELETAKLKRKQREQYDLIAKQINKVNSRRKSNQ